MYGITVVTILAALVLVMAGTAWLVGLHFPLTQCKP